MGWFGLESYQRYWITLNSFYQPSLVLLYPYLPCVILFTVASTSLIKLKNIKWPLLCFQVLYIRRKRRWISPFCVWQTHYSIRMVQFSTDKYVDWLSYLQRAVVVSIEGSIGSDTSCFQFTRMTPQRKWMKRNRKCCGGKRTPRWVITFCHEYLRYDMMYKQEIIVLIDGCKHGHIDKHTAHS